MPTKFDDEIQRLNMVLPILLDDRLNDEDRHALHGAAQALRNVLDATTWQPGVADVLSRRRSPQRGRIPAGALSGRPRN